MQFGYDNSRGGFLSSIPQATKSLIIINVLVFVMCCLNENLMIRWFAMFYPKSPFFHIWQVVTHMFMHGGIWHIFFNMYTLFLFGSVLERMWGSKKFLFFYFVTGLGAVALHTAVQWAEVAHYQKQVFDGVYAAGAAIQKNYMTPTVGASGAIYGLLLGYGMLFPDSIMRLLFPPVALKAKWFVLIFAGIELLTGISGVASGIAHFAHLGGMLFGWLLILYWKRKHKLYEYHN